MPPAHIQLDVCFVHSQAFGPYGPFRTIVVGGLGVTPELTAVEPLIAIIIHLSPECYPGWEGAVAESSEGAKTRDLVNISDKEDVAMVWSLRAGQRKHYLVEERITGEALVLPCIILRDFLGARSVEDSIDDLVMKGFELRKLFLQIQRFGIHLKGRRRLQNDEEVDLFVQLIKPDL